MIRRLLRRLVRGCESTLGVDLPYLDDVTLHRPGALLPLAGLALGGRFGRRMPSDALHTVRIGATRAQDCGACVQIAVDVAVDDGLAPSAVADALEGREELLAPGVRAAFRFGQALAVGLDAEEERALIRSEWGESALVEASSDLLRRVVRPLGLGRWAVPLLAGALVACGPAETPATDVVVRDSSGITIHELPAEVLEGSAPVTLAAEPSVQIGVVEGRAEYQWTRPVAGARLSNGDFAVLEQVPAEVRIFDAEGEFVRRIGAGGDGPGEFRSPSDLAVLAGDTLLVWDESARRLSWFSPDGALVRERTLREPGGIRLIRRVSLASSGVATVLGTETAMEDWGREAEGRTRERWRIVPVGVAGDAGESIGETPGTERVVDVARSADGSVASITVTGRWWWGDGFAWAHAGGVWTADRLALTARHFDADTGLDRIVRVAAPSRPFTNALIDSLHRVEIGRVDDPDLADFWRADIESREYPDLVPPVSGVFAAIDGSLWLGLVAPPPERLVGRLSSIPRWLVVPPAGVDRASGGPSSAAGVVELPPRSHPVWADGNGVLLVRRDVDLDVPFVEWYRMIDSEPEPEPERER